MSQETLQEMLVVLLVAVLVMLGTSTKLQNSRTIAISGGATGTATSFDGTANITIPVTSLDASKLTGTASVATTGNAGSATKLKDARTINGTSFNGTGNITTSKWGTARTLGLSGAVSGSASVDGSGNVTISTSQANIAVVTGTISLTNGAGNTSINYPSGYNSSNCVVISTGIDIRNYYSFGSDSQMIFSTRLSSSTINVVVTSIDNVGTSSTKNVKVVLMKIS